MKNIFVICVGSAAEMTKWHELAGQVASERPALGVQVWHEWEVLNKERIVAIGVLPCKTRAVGPWEIAGVRNALSAYTAYTMVRAEAHEATACVLHGDP